MLNMIIGADLDDSPGYWSEVIPYASYIHNRLPTKSGNSNAGKSPFESLFGYKSDVTAIRVFGCDAFAKLLNLQRSNPFSPVAQSYRMVGFSTTQKGYRLLDPTTNKIIVRCDVTFNEECFKLQTPERKKTGVNFPPQELMVNNRPKRNIIEKRDNEFIYDIKNLPAAQTAPQSSTLRATKHSVDIIGPSTAVETSAPEIQQQTSKTGKCQAKATKPSPPSENISTSRFMKIWKPRKLNNRKRTIENANWMKKPVFLTSKQ